MCKSWPHFLLQATLVGSRVFVFGGEDARRRSLGDLLVLDLQSMEWSSPKTTGVCGCGTWTLRKLAIS